MGWDVERNSIRAEESFRRALEADENFAEAHAGLAQALWRRYEESREARLVEESFNEAQQAVMLAPQLAEAHLALGVVLLGRGRGVEASASFEAKRTQDAENDHHVLPLEPRRRDAAPGPQGVRVSACRLALAA